MSTAGDSVTPVGNAAGTKIAAGRLLLGGIMMMMGALHFVVADTFVSVMPDYLPYPLLLVWLSGVAELALGVGLLVERTRVRSAYGLVALYVAVFPANLHMALHPDLEIAGLPADVSLPALALWLRLPLQLGLIAWALRYARSPSPRA